MSKTQPSPKTALVFFSFTKHFKGYYDVLFRRLDAHNQQRGGQFDMHQAGLKDLRIELSNDDFRIVDSTNHKDLADYDVVYFELWTKAPQQALAASTYLQYKQVPYLGPTVERIQPDTKLGELFLLRQAGLPIPATVSSSRKQLRAWFKEAPPLPFPVVIKSVSGYGGKANFLIHSRQEMLKVLNEYRDITFVVQEFLPNNKDYRFLVMDGEVQLVLERTGNGDTHLNNTSKGADARLLQAGDFPQEVQDLAVRAAEAVGRREFAGVDIIIDERSGDPYILEVNKTPQIEIGAHTREKMDALLDYLLRLSQEGDRT